MKISFIHSFTRFFPHLARMILLLAVLVFPITANAGAKIIKSTNTVVPVIILGDKYGNEQTVDYSKNKLTALHFWATWCVPCVEELPEVNTTQKKYAANGLNIVALSLDGKNTEKVQKFYSENKIDALEIFMDSNMSGFKSLAIKGLPTTIFVNSDGKEIARAEGPLGWQSAEVVDFIKSQIGKQDN